MMEPVSVAENPLYINVGNHLMDLRRPRVMGILNVTPDSFYAGCRVSDAEALASRVDSIRREGADIIDVGACSTRPGSPSATEREEWERLEPALACIRERWPEAVVSVDTFRSSIARRSVEEYGAAIINDVSGGTIDSDMFETVASLKVAYVLMHMRGTPADMQTLTDYEDVSADVLGSLMFRAAELRRLGVCDIILDPGFGFAKTVEQNYRLFSDLQAFAATGYAILVGISRKSMLWRPLGLTPEEVLPATVALNMAALQGGASILRVHDVAAARQTVEVYELLRKNARPKEECSVIEYFGNPAL